ncbi:MAG: hypothetical protein PHX10_13535 [Gallionellaceae bacterium]|nr:hypothetical protein [Gallionellaceae bacterium]
MSPLSPDARIAILPDRVAVAIGRAVTELTVPAEQPDALMRTLAEALAAARCKGRVEVVLSHALAPVWLVPAPALRLNWTETRGWVHEQLTNQLGDRVGHCRLAFQPAAPGEPLLVSALDETWLASLMTTLAGKGARAHTIQPWLVAAGNRRREKLRRGANWLALAEPGRLTLAFFQDGRPGVVRSLQVGGDLATALPDAVRREALLAGVPDGVPVWLEAVGVEADWRAAAGGRLDIRSPAAGKAATATLVGN